MVDIERRVVYSVIAKPGGAGGEGGAMAVTVPGGARVRAGGGSSPCRPPAPPTPTTKEQPPPPAPQDDLGSTDEVKVFKDEGDGEDDKRSSENLREEKSSLIDLTESEEKSGEPYSKLTRADHSPVFGKVEPPPHAGFNMGYLMPYPYSNGSGHPLPVSMASKMGLSAAGGLPLFCHNGDLAQPPPAHMGIPPYQLDKAAIGLTRPAMYPFPGGAYPYSMLGPEMSQVASWHTPSMYPISSVSSGFRSPYPTSLPISSASLSRSVCDFRELGCPMPSLSAFEHSELYRFSPSLIAAAQSGHPLSPHAHPLHPLAAHAHHAQHALSAPKPAPQTQDLLQHRYSRSVDKSSDKSQASGADLCGSSSTSGPNTPQSHSAAQDKNKKPHIKKPLNAFMLYMKEMRAKVVAECTLKESAAINQILGRRWHSLSRDEQAKYYEKARQERQVHMQLYPGWSARDNYGYGSKKKKRKKERSPADLGGNNLKKCRARYGLDQQNQWCKPCRRKKKCIRYMEALAAGAAEGGSVREGDDMDTSSVHDDMDSDSETGLDQEHSSMSASSPCLSALSSLTSPPGLLASPAASLASPLPEADAPHNNNPPQRLPVGTNPRDANNPLSVNRLTDRSLNMSHSSIMNSPYSPEFLGGLSGRVDSSGFVQRAGPTHGQTRDSQSPKTSKVISVS